MGMVKKLAIVAAITTATLGFGPALAHASVRPASDGPSCDQNSSGDWGVCFTINGGGTTVNYFQVDGGSDVNVSSMHLEIQEPDGAAWWDSPERSIKTVNGIGSFPVTRVSGLTNAPKGDWSLIFWLYTGGHYENVAQAYLPVS
jgi:hypothetical protein